jgi:hypothetical protein
MCNDDGIGAQYQKNMSTYIYCKMNNINFTYKPLYFVDHNYDNDPNYISKAEDLFNLKSLSIHNNNDILSVLHFGQTVQPYFEKNIDLCCHSIYMDTIKALYWENKDRDHYKNNKFNIAVHIRRGNCCDRGEAGIRITTPDEYYLSIISKIREKHANKELQFHIYSQGNPEDFSKFSSSDTKLYINYDIFDTFKGLVAANCLVTSPSSLSYVAALISDGEIYYRKFWHGPKKEWTVY